MTEVTNALESTEKYVNFIDEFSRFISLVSRQ